MQPSLLAVLTYSQLFYAVPLVLAVSLVYGATRHELAIPILHHAYRAAIWIVGFMLAIFAVLFIVSLAV